MVWHLNVLHLLFRLETMIVFSSIMYISIVPMAVAVLHIQHLASGTPCLPTSDLVHLLIFLNDWQKTIFLTISHCSNLLLLFTTLSRIEVSSTFRSMTNTYMSYNFYSLCFSILLCALVHSAYCHIIFVWFVPFKICVICYFIYL